MADGMFNSGGGSGGSSFGYSHGWEPNRGGGGGGGSSSGVGLVVLVVLVILIVLLISSAYNTHAELEEERLKDRTVYVETTMKNYAEWVQANGYDIREGSLWMEEGSSHRKGGNGSDYHCKGGQFTTIYNQTITFCCSVVYPDTPSCMVIP